MKAIASALLVLLYFSAAVVANDYYISPFGSNSNSGTSTQAPFLDLSTALAAASSGSTIHAADGFYTGSNNVGLTLVDINVEGNSASTVFQGDSNAIFTLSGSTSLSTLTLKSSSSATGASVKSEDITFNSVWFSSLQNGIELTPYVHNVTVTGCSFSNTVDKGIYYSSTSTIDWDHIVVEDSTFACSGKNIYINAQAPQTEFGLASFTNCGFTESIAYLTFSYGPDQLVVDQCSFTNITDTNAALYIKSRYATTVSDSAFTSCSSDSGGSLAVVDSTTVGRSSVTVSDSVFSDSYSKNYGGALYTTGVSVVVTGSMFVGNSAGSYGGAAYCTTGNNNAAAYSFTDSVFAYNVGDNGGAMRLQPILGATISDCDFGFNSGRSGGAISYDAYSSDALAISGSKFVSNVASSNAGAVYADDGNTLQFLDTYFFNNTAVSGAAVAIGDDAVLTVQHTLARGNDASVSGGAFYISDATASFAASAFVNNDAPTGGAIYSDGTSAVNMQRVVFDGNNADSSGGGIACSGGGVNVSKGVFVGNTSPNGASYSCSGSCGVYTSQSYVPTNSTSGCTPTYAMETADAEELMDSFSSMTAMSDREIHELYQKYADFAKAA